jgi:hypothetical protein
VSAARFSAKSKVGKILRDPVASRVLFEVEPALQDSPHLDLAKGISLERLSTFMGRDRAWLETVAARLQDVPDVGRNRTRPPAPLRDISDGSRSSAPTDYRSSAPLWGVLELVMTGPATGNPFLEVELCADFFFGDRSVRVAGFYDGDGIYRIRFMPDTVGNWTFRTSSNARSLAGVEGAFACTAPLAGSHGPVRVAGEFHFGYADGTPFRPFGTTCYAWTHQDEALEQRTLESLTQSPFNKIRMCVFPEFFLYNENEPRWHAFEPAVDGGFDLDRFHPQFFRHLEARVADLGRLGIQADLILFHPYDRWGYSELPADVDDRYVRYVVARLSAYSNVWWSLANEYDLVWDKEEEDWDRIGALVSGQDPHHHLIGVHQCFEFFDHSKSWVTHSSLQRVDLYRTAECATEWRDRWRKPVVIDECAYEGDIDMTWGNITGEEMTRRCWEGAVRGGYVGHGETYLSPNDVLWWSKGGDLRGESACRIGFLRSIMEQGPNALEPQPLMSQLGYPTAGEAGQYYLQYLGFSQPRQRTMQLPAGESYQVDVIDTWNMTISDAGVHGGDFTVELPGRAFLAVRLIRVPDREATPTTMKG